MREISTKEGHYPNPEYKWIEIFLGDTSLGRVDIEKNGSYRARPSTKSVKTVLEAARKIAEMELREAARNMKHYQQQVEKWRAIKKELGE